MNISVRSIFLLGQRNKEPVLRAVTPPRDGERTLLGQENLLASIAVPEPFSSELSAFARIPATLRRRLTKLAASGPRRPWC